MNDETQKAPPGKGTRERSPSFPFISLKSAIDRLVAFEEHYKRTPATADTIGGVWGMKVGSGNVAQTLSALKAFGLLETQRGPAGLEVTISDDGRTYLRAQQESVRREVIQRVALHPKQIRSHWDRWGRDRPKDAACLDDLVLKEGFTQDGAATFLRVYDSTIAYAGLVESDKNSDKLDIDLASDTDPKDSAPPITPQNTLPKAPPAQAKVGDYVQWTSGGVDQFAAPTQVTWVADDGCYLRVHGSLTGIPMNEVSILDAPKVPPVGALAPRQAAARNGGDDLNVLMTGGRLQITADVDLEGLKRLKTVLEKYTAILELLMPS